MGGIVALLKRKGGSGSTTIAANIGAEWHARGTTSEGRLEGSPVSSAADNRPSAARDSKAAEIFGLQKATGRAASYCAVTGSFSGAPSA